ncbi:FIG004453: protein YceG like [hydrothermal vent metagenome]|uniref:FIG004453: protein YceG like n=1 Tax=hydrothermal vent metagenome TaxID=652676 RepID=A0A3B1CQM2_9ZZZZ
MKRLIGVLILIAMSGSGLLLNNALTRPNGGAGLVVVEIAPGASTRAVSKKLFKAGVISSPALFEIETRFRGKKGVIRAGEFSLPRNISIRQVALRLARGGTVLHRVTIPEGLTIDETGDALEKAGIVGADEFKAALLIYSEKPPRQIPSKSLEGYLFPETYYFRKGVSAKEVIKTMVSEFYRQAPSVLPGSVMSDPDKLHRIITLASIIEKETGVDAERKLISSVFTNRLKKGMLLQSDPTVIYALPYFDGNLHKKDMKYDSPYNTYLHKGLPPGPIANPGLASIDAARRPLKEHYLYFVSKNNGEHHFSKTLKEHNRAVMIYQIKRGRR